MLRKYYLYLLFSRANTDDSFNIVLQSLKDLTTKMVDVVLLISLALFVLSMIMSLAFKKIKGIMITSGVSVMVAICLKFFNLISAGELLNNSSPRIPLKYLGLLLVVWLLIHNGKKKDINSDDCEEEGGAH